MVHANTHNTHHTLSNMLIDTSSVVVSQFPVPPALGCISVLFLSVLFGLQTLESFWTFRKAYFFFVFLQPLVLSLRMKLLPYLNNFCLYLSTSVCRNTCKNIFVRFSWGHCDEKLFSIIYQALHVLHLSALKNLRSSSESVNHRHLVTEPFFWLWQMVIVRFSLNCI